MSGQDPASGGTRLNLLSARGRRGDAPAPVLLRGRFALCHSQFGPWGLPSRFGSGAQDPASGGTRLRSCSSQAAAGPLLSSPLLVLLLLLLLLLPTTWYRLSMGFVAILSSTYYLLPTT